MKVWLVEYVEVEGEDNHNTLMRICDSYEKAKAYVERQYEYGCAHIDKEYDSITKLNVVHRETHDQFWWYENDEILIYFVSCKTVM